MAGDDFESLMKARAALAKKRLSWAQTISTTGDIPDKAVEGLILVQQAIDVVERAIDELEELDAEEEDEE